MGLPIGHECPEEKAARGEDGPGVVLDGEELGLFVLQDDKLTADGELAPSAVPIADLLEPEREGLSVGRLRYLTREELHVLIEGYVRRNSANRFRGGGVTLTGGVRGLRGPDGRRCFCVVDDPREGYRSHALVRLADRAAYGKGTVRRVRRLLMDLLEFRPATAFPV